MYQVKKWKKLDNPNSALNSGTAKVQTRDGIPLQNSSKMKNIKLEFKMNGHACNYYTVYLLFM